MARRIARRAARARARQPLDFLSPESLILGPALSQDARDGNFISSDPQGPVPVDSGHGPAAKPGRRSNRASVTSRMPCSRAPTAGCSTARTYRAALDDVLDNQRNLTLAINRAPVFLQTAETVAAEMNAWAKDSSSGDRPRLEGSVTSRR
jgi:hypothetical protein